MGSPTPHSRAHSLRHILFAALALVLLLLTGAQFLATGHMTERQLLEIESGAAFARLRRLHRALDVLEEDLSSTTADWAQWEGLNRFARGEYPDFAVHNLPLVTYTGLRLDLMAIVDAQGRGVYSGMLSEDARSVVSAPEELLALIERDGALGHASAGVASVRGLVRTSAGVFLICVEPVRNYEGEVLSNARLLMGRSLPLFVRPSLERVTGEVLAVLPPQTRLPRIGQTTSGDGGDLLHLTDGELEGVTMLSDIWGQPIAQLHLQAPRPTQTLVRDSHRRLLLTALVIGALLCLTVVIIVRSRVVAPLERLAAAVERLGEGDPGARVPVERTSREFETLSTAINSMLEQREQQQALQRDRDAAVEANRLKSEFLATMSHEIRMPMNGVLGMCELLQRTPLDGKQRRLADAIVRSARSLLDILSDILDFSKIESGRLELESAPFAPAEFVQAVAEPFAAAAERKGLVFQVELDSALPGVVIGDALRLRQVLNNLLANALKFTAAGSVTLSCSVTRVEVDRITLRFVIADTGVGVPESAREHIFNAFAQAESSTTRRFGGTGLGLAIVRRLATLMGGDVALQSELDRGSKFTLTVPLQRAPEAMRVDAATATGVLFAAGSAPLVLLVEDHAVNREVLHEMLELFGCRVTSVENGAEALRQAAVQDFDVILMDCHMPVMDGYTAVSELRALERAAQRTTAFIIALTADVTAENRARCLSVGVDEIAAKPITQLRLRALIKHAMDARSTPSAPLRAALGA